MSGAGGLPRFHALAVAVMAAATLGCGSGRIERSDVAPPTSTTTVDAEAGGADPLDDVLVWLLSPVATCPPPNIQILQPSDDSMQAFLQLLGLVPNSAPACAQRGGG